MFQQRGNVSGEIWRQFERVKVLSRSRDILEYKLSDKVPKIYRFTVRSIISMALNRVQRILLETKNYFNEKFNAPPTFPVYMEETTRVFGDSECYHSLGYSMVGNIECFDEYISIFSIWTYHTFQIKHEKYTLHQFKEAAWESEKAPETHNCYF